MPTHIVWYNNDFSNVRSVLVAWVWCRDAVLGQIVRMCTGAESLEEFRFMPVGFSLSLDGSPRPIDQNDLIFQFLSLSGSCLSMVCLAATLLVLLTSLNHWLSGSLVASYRVDHSSNTNATITPTFSLTVMPDFRPLRQPDRQGADPRSAVRQSRPAAC
jgi:hypothetical protein